MRKKKIHHVWVLALFLWGGALQASVKQAHEKRHTTRLSPQKSSSKARGVVLRVPSHKLRLPRPAQGTPQQKASRSQQNLLRRRRRSKIRILRDIRYVQYERYTRVVLVVSGRVQIEEGEAPAVVHQGLPPRLYVDLTPCVPLRKWRTGAMAIQGTRLRRIRVGRHTRKTTRVVFELGEVGRSQVSVLSDPVRIVIDLADRDLPPKPTSKMKLPSAQPILGGGGQRPTTLRPNVNPPEHRIRPSKRPFVLRYDGQLKLPFPVRVQRLAIDAGHGGREDGAIGLRTRLREKKVTLDIARRLVRWLRTRTSIEIFLTRDRDQHISISQRALLVKRKAADLLVSIHINANRDRKLQGLATYLLNWDERFYASQLMSSNALMARENQGVDPRLFQDVNMILSGMQVQNHSVVSRILGVAIQRSMYESVQLGYPESRDLGVRSGLFYLLFAAEVPGVLVEASFLTNPREERLLGTPKYRQTIAEGIGKGILKFLEVAKKTPAVRRRPSPQPRQK
ncbi:MAG: N-acetylmuramoyl-L-alanine amidase [Myxococcales bacterium]|nr:N-acetylmuramoyl-L-alanine amidase [Myxococcales bacterium]